RNRLRSARGRPPGRGRIRRHRDTRSWIVLRVGRIACADALRGDPIGLEARVEDHEAKAGFEARHQYTRRLPTRPVGKTTVIATSEPDPLVRDVLELDRPPEPTRSGTLP